MEVFPDICIREAADVVKASKDIDAASNVTQTIVSAEEVARALQAFEDAEHDENIPEDFSGESVSASWGRHIHSLSEKRHIELPSYELMLEKCNAIQEGHIEGPSHTEKTLRQIAKDADRNGFQPASFDEEVSVDTLVKDWRRDLHCLLDIGFSGLQVRSGSDGILSYDATDGATRKRGCVLWGSPVRNRNPSTPRCREGSRGTRLHP